MKHPKTSGRWHRARAATRFLGILMVAIAFLGLIPPAALRSASADAHVVDDKWTPAGPPQFAVSEGSRLADGRIMFAVGTGSAAGPNFALYHPAKDTWTVTTPAPYPGRDFDNLVITALANGDALVHWFGQNFVDDPIYRYYASPPPGQLEWAEVIEPGVGDNRGYDPTIVLLDGPECAVPTPPGHCGKVLLAGGERHNVADTYQLYNPETNTLEITCDGECEAGNANRKRIPTQDNVYKLHRSDGAQLPDGTVLAAGATRAWYYHPIGDQWSGAPRPPRIGVAWSAFYTEAKRFPGGQVLFAGGNPNNEANPHVALFDPYLSPPGWVTVPNCPPRDPLLLPQCGDVAGIADDGGGRGVLIATSGVYADTTRTAA